MLTSRICRTSLFSSLVAAFLLLSTVVFAQSDASLQLLLGNPSNAVTNSSYTTNYLISRPQYALAYSNTARIPKWVSWHLAPPDLGTATRTTSFYADTSLPSGWYEVTNSDYTGSGYDRGHNCPSADRTATAADNKALFYMTNIMPQQADNNQGPWESLETYCRSLVTDSGKELYIITCYDTTNGTIAGGKVAIPKNVYKIIVVIPYASGNDLTRITASTTVIAVKMPNVAGIRSNPWTQYITNVNAIESATGLHFFTALPSATQSALKSKTYVP